MDYSKGAVSIRIPLGTMPVEGFTWPLALSYNTSGIKVNEIASNVGLGWSLNCIGTISSKVIGTSDVISAVDQDPNILKRDLNLSSAAPGFGLPCSYNSPGDMNIANQVASTGRIGGNNYLPDLFYLNIGTLHHTFFLKDTVGYTMPASNISIKLKRTPTYRFEVIDESGVKYYLSIQGHNRTNNYCSEARSSFFSDNYLFCVDSIRTPLNDLIRFYYSSHTSAYELTPLETRHESYPQYYPGTACGYFYPPTPGSTCHPLYISREARIDSIVTNQRSKVTFSYTTRSDIPPHASYGNAYGMTGFQISNAERTIRQVEFSQSYFGPSGSPTAEFLRLRLDGVLLKDVLNNSTVKQYSFSYNSEPLPSRLSFAQDSAGLYNGEHANTTLIPKFSNRNFNINFARAGILEKITYPEGGSTQLEYEKRTLKSGGLRIKKIIDEVNGQNMQRTYTYSDPEFAEPNRFEEMKVVPFNHLPEYSYYYLFDYCELYSYFSTPTSTIFDSYLDDPDFYPVVQEFYGNSGEGGKKMYFFEPAPGYSYASYKLPPILKSTQVFRRSGQDYMLSSSEENQYDGYLIPGAGRFDDGYGYESRIWGKEFKKMREQQQMYPQGGHSSNGPTMCVSSVIYQSSIVLISHRLNRTQTVTKVFDQLGDSISTSQIYVYSAGMANLPSHVTTTDSEGHITKVRYKYSSDFLIATPVGNPAKGLKALRDKGVNNAEVERITSVKVGTSPEMVTEAYYIQYAEEYPVPSEVSVIEVEVPVSDFAQSFHSSGSIIKDSRYVVKNKATSFGSRGVSTAYELADGEPVAVLWDQLNIYPVAKFKNAYASDVAYTSFEDESKGNWAYSGNTSASEKYSGKKSYLLSTGSITRTGLNSLKSYVVSYWSKNGAYLVAGSTSTLTGPLKNGWTYFEHTVKNSSSCSISGNGFIDEIRLYPADAYIQSYSYEHLVGMSGEVDTRGLLSSYEYDGFGRLIRIRNVDGQILKQWEYLYRATLFSNSCGTQSNWQPTGTTRCVLDANYATTGELEIQQMDMNPCSITYSQIQWVNVGMNAMACPSCSGVDKRLINGICETGVKICDGDFRQNGQPYHYYHYKWSDNSISATFVGQGRCAIAIGF